jgi:hypothetical protein
MRSAFVLALAALMLAGGRQVVADDKPAGKQLIFKITALEGDPLGSREAGTLRSLAEPTIGDS